MSMYDILIVLIFIHVVQLNILYQNTIQLEFDIVRYAGLMEITIFFINSVKIKFN